MIVDIGWDYAANRKDVGHGRWIVNGGFILAEK